MFRVRCLSRNYERVPKPWKYGTVCPSFFLDEPGPLIIMTTFFTSSPQGPYHAECMSEGELTNIDSGIERDSREEEDEKMNEDDGYDRHKEDKKKPNEDDGDNSHKR